MQGFRFSICSVLIITLILALNTGALAAPPRNNIRINFGVWDIPDSDLGISVKNTNLGNNERFTNVEVLGLSGTLAFSHIISPRFAWELSVGGFSNSETEVLSEKADKRYRGDHDHYETIYSYTHSVSVSYLTVGLIYYPMYELKDSFGSLDSFFRPYLTPGIGPYF